MTQSMATTGQNGLPYLIQAKAAGYIVADPSITSPCELHCSLLDRVTLAGQGIAGARLLLMLDIAELAALALQTAQAVQDL